MISFTISNVLLLQLISATDRHRQSTDHPIKFILRRQPYTLKFKIKPGTCHLPVVVFNTCLHLYVLWQSNLCCKDDLKGKPKNGQLDNEITVLWTQKSG